MKLISHFLSSLFTKCVRCYPTEFRMEFEEEMCAVFSKAMTEVEGRRFQDFLLFAFREFRELPKNLFYEHWSQLEESLRGATPFKLESDPIDTSTQMDRSNWMDGMDHQDLHLPGKRQRILAALPLFLFGLGISLTSLIQGGPWYSVPSWRLIFSIALGLLPMAVIATVGVIALFRRIPDWGITWVGSAFMGLIIFVKTLSEELADAGQHIISEPVEIALVIMLFLAGVALLVIVGIRGWQRGGLLSIGLSVTFTLSFLWAVTAAPSYRHDLAVWAGPIGLLIAVLTAIYANSTPRIRSIILIGIGIVNYGSIFMANTMWQNSLLSTSGTFSPIAFILFMLAFLICGPIVGLIVKPIQHAFRRA
jgi:hypothetical protein